MMSLPAASSSTRSLGGILPSITSKAWYSLDRSVQIPLKSELPAKTDVVIVGGGVTGTSLLYSLAAFTDVKSALLLEKRKEFARVASGPNNNSQTIHCGDIETNYTPEKAAKVKRLADMLRNYATKLPPAFQDVSIAKMQKMAIGVGSEEVHKMEKRYELFKPYFPNMKLIYKEEIAKREPAVAYSNINMRTFRPEPVAANYVENEHAAVDYYNLSKSFIHQSEHERGKREILSSLGTNVIQIIKDGPSDFRILTNKGIVHAKYVIVSACGFSLLHAHRLGYGLNYSCLPVAGSFYFGPKILTGKVYAVQNPELPFAAVHGDPDLIAGGLTRFGPTALAMPLLERYEWGTFWDFLEVLRPSKELGIVGWNLIKNRTIRNYMMRNVLFEVPILNRRLFLQDIRKICPSLTLDGLKYAHGFGGVRPQLVDKEQKKLLLGEGKVKAADANLIFNVTPSPGGTTCLGNAEEDLRTICKALGYNVNEKKFKEILLYGQYPVQLV